MSKISNTMIFFGGCAVGIIISQQYFKNFYEKKYQEDSESVKRAFMTDRQVESKDSEENVRAAEAAKEKPGLSEYTEKLKENGYTNYSDISSGKPASEIKEPVVDEPYVISPEEFGEFDDYNQISLTYYADGVLTEGDDVIDDVDEIVGEESLTRFGEFEDDSVHVRNDRLRCDYEILLDNRNFEDVIKAKPRQIELED